MRRPVSHRTSHRATFARPVAKQGQDRIFWLEHTRSGEQMEYMRKSGKVFRHGVALLALVSLLVAAVLVVMVLAAPASAQVLDYGKLFGTGGSAPAASQPQQSLPGAAAGPRGAVSGRGQARWAGGRRLSGFQRNPRGDKGGLRDPF